jgi:thiol-disulfide isomerase/thioredoxin
MLRTTPALTAFALLVLSGCSRSAPTTAAPEGLESVTADQLKSKVRSLGAKAVMVNAWATWCGSCEHELPMLQGIADRFAPQGVRVLLVSVDEADETARAKAFLKEHAIGLTSYWAARPLDSFKLGMNPRWPGMLPASFLFDSTGRLRYFWGGEAFENEVVPIIEGFLAGKPIDGEANFAVVPGESE